MLLGGRAGDELVEVRGGGVRCGHGHVKNEGGWEGEVGDWMRQFGKPAERRGR